MSWNAKLIDFFSVFKGIYEEINRTTVWETGHPFRLRNNIALFISYAKERSCGFKVGRITFNTSLAWFSFFFGLIGLLYHFVQNWIGFVCFNKHSLIKKRRTLYCWPASLLLVPMPLNTMCKIDQDPTGNDCFSWYHLLTSFLLFEQLYASWLYIKCGERMQWTAPTSYALQ